MRNIKATPLALALMATIALAATPLLAEKEQSRTFVEMAKEMPDGKLSKDRVMAALERTFDRADTRKEKKIDAQQARQFQIFLKEFTRDSGG